VSGLAAGRPRKQEGGNGRVRTVLGSVARNGSAPTHEERAIDYARELAAQDVEFRYPIASNRFRDSLQQLAYEEHYRASRSRGITR